jgi:hypothetical protein
MKRKRWRPKRPYRRFMARRFLFKSFKHLSKAGMQLRVDRAAKARPMRHP